VYKAIFAGYFTPFEVVGTHLVDETNDKNGSSTFPRRQIRRKIFQSFENCK